jgi:transposase
MTIDEVPFALAIEQPRVSAETRGLLLARTAADNAASRTPARDHGKRALVTAVSRLLSTLLRWTGVRP